MKTSHPILMQPQAPLHALLAIGKIQRWALKFYPRFSSKRRLRMILECLIELNEERKFLQSQ